VFLDGEEGKKGRKVKVCEGKEKRIIPISYKILERYL